MREALSDVVISVDSHIGETNAFRERLRLAFRDEFPEFLYSADGHLESQTLESPTKEDMLREFCTDPDMGTNVERHPHDEGIFLPSAGPITDIRARLSDDDAHRVLCGNAARLYGCDHLAAHRDEITSYLPQPAAVCRHP